MAFYLSHQLLQNTAYASYLPKNCEFFLAIETIESCCDEANTTHNPPSGSQACRKLLQKLQQNFRIEGILADQQLPYRLIGKTVNSDWYISLSHSTKQVAVLLANTAYLGIDIEDKAIAIAVAQRYFSQADNEYLASLDTPLQAMTRQLLWVIKESQIKAQGNSHQPINLTYGLSKTVVAQLAQVLIWQSVEEIVLLSEYVAQYQSTAYSSIDYPQDKRLFCAYLEPYQCGFLLKMATDK